RLGSVLRQAVRARLARREWLGSHAARTRSAGRSRRPDAREVRRSIRTVDRRLVRRLAAMKARVAIDVMLKDGILDPQGKTVEENLPSLGFEGVSGVRVGKHIELDIEAASRDEAVARVEEMSRRRLSNPVIEDFTYRIET